MEIYRVAVVEEPRIYIFNWFFRKFAHSDGKVNWLWVLWIDSEKVPSCFIAGISMSNKYSSFLLGVNQLVLNLDSVILANRLNPPLVHSGWFRILRN